MEGVSTRVAAHRFRVRAAAALIASGLALALAGACAGSAPGDPGAATPAERAAAAAATSAPFALPSGPAVTVPVGYVPPRDRVDSTGAHLPANGKPTLVFVDAIW